jgi:hypothetical protein
MPYAVVQVPDAASLRGKSSEEPPFHQFHRKQVCQQHGSQDKEKEGRRRYETEVTTDRSERQENGHCDHGQGTSDKPGIWAALEGVFAGMDNEDYQHLRSH